MSTWSFILILQYFNALLFNTAHSNIHSTSHSVVVFILATYQVSYPLWWLLLSYSLKVSGSYLSLDVVYGDKLELIFLRHALLLTYLLAYLVI
jgi:hypothetical protein